MDAGHYILLIYIAIFVPMYVLRPLWPFRFKKLVRASPEALWQLISDHKNVPAMFPHVSEFDARRDPDDPNIFHCTARLKRRGKELKYVVRILELRPCELIKQEFLGPDRDRLWGRGEYRLTAEGLGTLIVLRARIRVAGVYGIFCNWRIYRRHLKQLEALAEWS